MKFFRKSFIFAQCTALMLSVCILSSCSETEEESVKPVKIEENFSFIVDVTQSDFKCSADFRRNGESYECKLTKPDSIKGMVVSISGDVVNIDYRNMKYQLDRKNMPQASCISLITKSVDKICNQKDLSCRKTENGVIEKGTVSGLDFSAVIKENKLKSIDFGDTLSVKFR